MTTSNNAETKDPAAVQRDEATSQPQQTAGSTADTVPSGRFGGMVTRVQNLQGRVGSWFDRVPNPVTHRQPCVAEIVEYSKTGDYTAEPNYVACRDRDKDSPKPGAKRTAHYCYTRGFAAPIIVICDLIKCWVRRPDRFVYGLLTLTFFAVGAWLLL